MVVVESGDFRLCVFLIIFFDIWASDEIANLEANPDLPYELFNPDR